MNVIRHQGHRAGLRQIQQIHAALRPVQVVKRGASSSSSPSTSPSPSSSSSTTAASPPATGTDTQPVANPPSQDHNSPSSSSSTHPSSHPAAHSASFSASTPPIRTIPGPSWVWLQPLGRPFRAYGRAQAKRPYVTQLVSSLIIYFFGDLAAQHINPDKPVHPQQHHHQEEESSAKAAAATTSADDGQESPSTSFASTYNPARTLRALIIGGISSIPSYKWFLFLGRNFNYPSSHTLSLMTKVVVNQAFFTPLFNSYFFGMQAFLSGAGQTTFREIVDHLSLTVPVSWWNSCKLWPAVTAFSFTFIPPEYRSVFAGVVAIGWQTYLTLLHQRAHEVEVLEHEEEEARGEAREEVKRPLLVKKAAAITAQIPQAQA